VARRRQPARASAVHLGCLAHPGRPLGLSATEVRPGPWEKKARPVQQLVRRDLSETAARPVQLTEVHPDLVLVPRSVLWDPRPVLLWVTAVRRILEMVRRPVCPVPVHPALETVRRPVRPVPVRRVPARFPPPARRPVRWVPPEHRQATADAAASSAA
jgi:hypothetical protein